MGQKAADILKQFFYTHSIRIADFSRLSGVSRTSIYKYLEGQPVHPKKAKAMSKAIWDKYLVDIPAHKFFE